MERLLGSNRAPSRNKPNTTTPSLGGAGPCNCIQGNIYNDEIVGREEILSGNINLEEKSS